MTPTQQAAQQARHASTAMKQSEHVDHMEITMTDGALPRWRCAEQLEESS